MMNIQGQFQDQARADLAFLKSITDEHSPILYSTGLIYGAAGLLYGLQCMIFWADMRFGLSFPDWTTLATSVLPTVIFATIVLAVTRNRKATPKSTGVLARAIDATFAGAGLANLVLLVIFAMAALRRSDFSIWLFFPVTVCVLQGAAWYVLAVLRRRWWMGCVAIGWFATALIASQGIIQGNSNPQYFVFWIGAGLYAFMAVPGFILMQISRSK